MKDGLAGSIAKVFMNSKLTILLMIMFMVIGVYSSFLIPREEEPQIDVPIADIFVSYPGASPEEVESRVIKPLEKIVSNIKGIEYVYSTSMNEQAMLIVQPESNVASCLDIIVSHPHTSMCINSMLLSSVTVRWIFILVALQKQHASDTPYDTSKLGMP